MLRATVRSSERITGKVLDILFPPRCPFCDGVTAVEEGRICLSCRKKLSYIGQPCCMKCGRPLKKEEDEYCPDCLSSEHDFIRNRAVFCYDDIVRRAIYRFKYGRRKEYADTFAYLSVSYLGEWIKEISPDAIVPVPLHRSRLRKRGFNQAALFASALSKYSGFKYMDIAVRIRPTQPQKKLGYAARRKNLKKAFKIRQNDVKLDTVLLVDDIYTTGSTLDELAGVFKDNGVKNIYALTISIGIGG